MKTKVIVVLMVTSAVFSALPCVAHVVTGVPDKTEECLNHIDWKASAFETKAYPGVILIKADSFDGFLKCAYAGVDFASGLQLPLSSDKSFKAKLSEMTALMQKYPEIDEDIYAAAGYLSVSVDLVIGAGTEKHPTVIFRADFRADFHADPSLPVPIDKIRHRDLTYQRSPAHPGFCDDLKGDVERYAWCNGERRPSENDPQLHACKNQYCDPYKEL